MNILISAIACRPGAGSEWHVGWTSVMALARQHTLSVLTHGFNRNEIDAAMQDHPLRARVQFHYLREPIQWNENRMIARFQDWMDYRTWCGEARILAGTLCREHRFDLAHHITFATWRVPSPLAGLGLPMVFGPVGGGEVFPARFYSILSPAAKTFELARVLSNRVSLWSPTLRKAVSSASVLLPNNVETAAILKKAGAREEQIQIATQSFITASKMEQFESWRSRRGTFDGGELRIFAGGNLEGRKGVSIALRALAVLKRRGIPFRFLYGGHGPELRHLLRLRDRLGLQDCVQFENMLEKEAYLETLHASHVYLLPSLREGCPITLLEAMLAGCVPVVARCGGQAVAVTPECGILVDPVDPETLEAGLVNALIDLAGAPERWTVLSQAARERVRSGFSEEGYIAAMEAAYACAQASRGSTGFCRI